MAKSKHYYIRKIHRYLGVILGIQFMFWTISGLYFSWSNIDEIHGDFERRKAPLIHVSGELVSPSVVVDSLRERTSLDSIFSLQLIDILGRPVYQVRYTIPEHRKTHDPSMHDAGHLRVQLVDATTGRVRPPLSEPEAIRLAGTRFNGEPEVIKVVHLEKTNGHHEYRASPLPAYGVTFNNEAQTTVYIASELGTVQSFRNNKWRIFDFLWMTHTMDYNSRDNIGNTLLRVFSLFGLITVLSGFALYFVSLRRFRRFS